MKIEMHEISIKDVYQGYKDNAEDGVVAYNGLLNVRPPFQREFVYKDKQRDEVINTVRKGFPLNVMYWVKNNDTEYELLDGQQRTISICQYINGDFSINYQYFHNLTQEEKDQILNYKLMIYICEGTDKEKLDWFKIINISGEELTTQELRNAIYTGKWLTEAKRYFSKTGCPCYQMAQQYMKGVAIRQEYLETVLKWISARDGKEIEEYMAMHQHDPNSAELWLYFTNVINWVKAYFPKYRKEMKGIEWGLLYNEYKDKPLDANTLEQQISKLMKDDDITNTKGIYHYVLDGKEKHLNIRAFDNRTKRIVYEQQKGICVKCGLHFEIDEMEADHITPWHLGGQTVLENCQMLCRDCNRRKSGK